MPTVALPEEIKTMMNNAQALLGDGAKMDRLHYLRCRWLDEGKYEPWSGYVDELKKLVPEGFVFERAGKSPFGFTMTPKEGVKNYPHIALHVTATTSAMKWKLIRTERVVS